MGCFESFFNNENIYIVILLLLYNYIITVIMVQFAEKRVSERRHAELRLDFQIFSGGRVGLEAE